MDEQLVHDLPSPRMCALVGWASTSCPRCGLATRLWRLGYPEGAPPLPEQCACPPRGTIEEMEDFKVLIVAIRALRQDMSLPASTPLRLCTAFSDFYLRLRLHHEVALRHMVNATVEEGERAGPSATVLAAGCVFFVPLAGVCDLEIERARLTAALARERADVEALTRRLGTPGFTERAPAAIVEEVRVKLATAQARATHLDRALADLT